MRKHVFKMAVLAAMVASGGVQAQLLSDPVAIGNGSTAPFSFSVSVGDAATGLTRTIMNVRDGVNRSDAATYGQLQDSLFDVYDVMNVRILGPAGEISRVRGLVGALSDRTEGNYVAFNEKLDELGGFLANRITEVDERATLELTRLDGEIVRLDAVDARLDTRIDVVETHVDRIDNRVTQIETTVENHEQRISALENRVGADINQLRREAFGGVAAIAAMSQAAPALAPGEQAVTMGVGAYGGARALSIGLVKVNYAGQVFTARAARATGGKTALSAGVAIRF